MEEFGDIYYVNDQTTQMHTCSWTDFVYLKVVQKQGRNNPFTCRSLTVLKGLREKTATMYLWNKLLDRKANYKGFHSCTKLHSYPLNIFHGKFCLLAGLWVIHFQWWATIVWKHMTDSPITHRSEGQCSQKANVLHHLSALGEAAEPPAAAGNCSPLTSLKMNAWMYCMSEGV